MKRIIQAMVVAALFSGTQAMAEDGMILVPSHWTYADRNAGGGGSDEAFPGASREDPIVLPSQSTPANGLAQAGSVDPFPGSAREDPIVVESMSTYADNLAAERNVQARGASDPALSQ